MVTTTTTADIHALFSLDDLLQKFTMVHAAQEAFQRETNGRCMAETVQRAVPYAGHRTAAWREVRTDELVECVVGENTMKPAEECWGSIRERSIDREPEE